MLFDMDLIREWVRAEIALAVAEDTIGPDGEYVSTKRQRATADELFKRLKEE